MERYILISVLTLHSGHSLRVVRHSQPATVHQGEEASLFCQADSQFDYCSWLLPNQQSCGPLSTTQSVCRAASNIHFTGSETNCSIRIDRVRDNQSGQWNCSLQKDSDVVVATNIQLTAALQANVDWDGEVYGGYLISNRDNREQSLTCRANHSRPLGSFVWNLGEGPNATEVENQNQIMRKDYDNDIVEVWQEFTLHPKPQLHGQTLTCNYIQRDNEGNVFFTNAVNVDILVHYLAPLQDAPSRLEEEEGSGHGQNISFKFEARPKPEAATWLIKGDEEIVIEVSPNKNIVVQNYVVYPLEQVSEFVWRATMTVLKMSAEENYKDHSFVVSNRMTPDSEPMEIRQAFDVNVPGLTVTLIVVIILVILIAIILVAMLVVYLKKNNKLCFDDKSNQLTNPDVADLKEPLNLKVQHHPYSRPSS